MWCHKVPWETNLWWHLVLFILPVPASVSGVVQVLKAAGGPAANSAVFSASCLNSSTFCLCCRCRICSCCSFRRRFCSATVCCRAAWRCLNCSPVSFVPRLWATVCGICPSRTSRSSDGVRVAWRRVTCQGWVAGAWHGPVLLGNVSGAGSEMISGGVDMSCGRKVNLNK